MNRNGRSGPTYLPAPERFGSAIFRGSIGSYGTWLRRWLMMLSRPRFLSSVRARYHGAHGGVRRREHRIPGA